MSLIGFEIVSRLWNIPEQLKINPINVTCCANIAAVCYESKRYGECVELCKTAIDIGQLNFASPACVDKLHRRIQLTFKGLKD